MKITGDKRRLTVLEMEKEYPDVWILVTNIEGGSFIGNYKTATGIVHAHTNSRMREEELYELWDELYDINKETGEYGDISNAPFFLFCEYTAIITKLEDIELKAVGYFVADLSNTNYDVIIGMSFLKNLDFMFKFCVESDYGGELILHPRIKTKSLVDIKNFNPTSSKFGIYSIQEDDDIDNPLTKSSVFSPPKS